MLIDMYEAEVGALEHVWQVLTGPQALGCKGTADDTGCCTWVLSALRRFDCRRQLRGERGRRVGELAAAQRLQQDTDHANGE